MHLPRAGLVSVLAASICSASILHRGSDNLASAIPGSTHTNSNLELDYAQYALSTSVKNALRIIKDVERLPSCHKMANAALIHDCAHFEPGNRGEHRDVQDSSDLALEESKKLYATRLAVCELHSADVHVPTACQSFIPTIRTTKKRAFKGFFTTQGHTAPTETFPDYEQVTADNLAACIRALHDEGNSQGWTSYSGSLKHAAPLCHAMRSEIEKDEQINLYKALTEDIAKTMSLSKEELENSKIFFHEFRTGMKKSYSDLLRGNDEQQKKATNMWTRIGKAAENGLSSLAHTLNSLQSLVLSTSENIEHNRHEMNKVVNETSTQLRETNAQYREASEATMAEASLLHEIVVFTAERLQQGIIQGVYNITQDLALTNAMITKNYDDLHLSDTLIVDLIASIVKLSNHVGSIKSDFDQFKVDHQRSHLELQIESNKTYEIIKKVNQEAGSLVAFFPGGWLEVGSSILLFLRYTVIFALVSFALWPKFVSFTTVGTVCVSVATGLVAAYSCTSYLNFSGSSPVVTELWLSLQENTTPTQRWIGAFILSMMALLPRCLHFYLQLVRSSCGEQYSQDSFPATLRFDNNDQMASPRYIDEEATPKHEFRLAINNPRFFTKNITPA